MQRVTSPHQNVFKRRIHTDINRLVERANNMTIGDPMNNPDIGAIVSETQMNQVLSYIEKGKQEGAVCLCGRFLYQAHGLR